MKLEEWIIKNNLTQEQFALQSGISQSTISRLISNPGARNPTWKVIDAIRKATNGEVSPNDLFEPSLIQQ